MTDSTQKPVSMSIEDEPQTEACETVESRAQEPRAASGFFRGFVRFVPLGLCAAFIVLCTLALLVRFTASRATARPETKPEQVSATVKPARRISRARQTVQKSAALGCGCVETEKAATGQESASRAASDLERRVSALESRATATDARLVTVEAMSARARVSAAFSASK